MHKYLLQYSRVSSYSQLDGSGLQHQQLSSEVLQELCIEHSLDLYPEVFSDKAVSAFKVNAAERPSFSRLLTLIESNQVDKQSVLVLHNLDRLSRENISTALSTLLRVLESCRIYISQEKRLFDKDDPNLMVNLMMALISLSRANEESEVKRKRKNQSVQSILDRHHAGERGKLGGVLWYYAGGYPFWFNLVDGELVLNETMVCAVREVVSMVINGSTLNAAYRYLEENYTPPRLHKNGWAKNIISNLHKNKALIGEWSYRGESLDNYLEPIIDEKTYYQFVNARNKRNLQIDCKPKGNTSIFTGYGIAHCRNCGEPMTKHSTQGYIYLRCASVTHGKPCSNAATLSEKSLLEALNRNLMQSAGLVKDEPTDSNLPMLEAQLGARINAVSKMQQDYMDTQASFLIPMIQSKQGEIDALMVQIEEEKRRTNVFIPDVPSEIPTDRDELRKLYRDTLTGLKFWKLGNNTSTQIEEKLPNLKMRMGLPTKGTLVSVYTIYGISFSMVLWQGRVTWMGKLTESDGFDEENSLMGEVWGRYSPV